MSQPNPTAERKEYEHQMHLEAGLVLFGKDSDGYYEYVGTDEKWKAYQTLLDNRDEF